MTEILELQVPIAAKCPFCAAQMSQHTAMTPSADEVPEHGDFAMCIGCGEWCTFVVDENDHAIGLRKPTDDEYELFVDPTYPEFAMVRATWEAAVAEAKAEKKRKAAEMAAVAGSFTEEWENYERDVLPKLGPKAKRMLKDTFFAGAMTLLATLRDVAQNNPGISAKMTGFSAVRDEIEGYLEERVRR